MPCTPNLADFNEPPSDAVLQEATEFCAIVRRDLGVDAEIQQLREKGAVIQKPINSYTTIFSSTR